MSGPAKHVHTHQASDAAAPAETKGPRLSIWFFVGILCLSYGLVLFPLGIYQLSHPPAVVLTELHVTIWWGVLLTLVGGFYTLRFRP